MAESVSKRPSWDEYYLGIAQAVSARGDCSRRQVGAVVVARFDNRIVSTGYNGVAPGEPGCLEMPCFRVMKAATGRDLCNGYSDCRSAHAEANALVRASHEEMAGATLYLTDWPCDGCWKLIRAAGITRVVTKNEEWCV